MTRAACPLALPSVEATLVVARFGRCVDQERGDHKGRPYGG
jgi:hypothetical protein